MISGKPSIPAPLRRALVVGLALLAVFLVWDRLRRPAVQGIRLYVARPDEADPAWCAARCVAEAKQWCYDEAELCRRYGQGQDDCSADTLRANPVLAWRYQCIVAAPIPAESGQIVPKSCLYSCY